MPADSKTHRILILFFLLAVLFRVAILGLTWDRQTMTGISGESIDVAKHLAAGHGFASTTEDGFKPNYHELPGYPLFLSLPISIFGEEAGLWTARLIQILLSSLGVWLAFRIGNILFGHGPGLISALIWALLIPEAHLSTHLLHDAPLPVLALLATYLFVRGAVEKKDAWLWLCAVVVGIASLTRSDLLLLPIFFFVALLVWDWHHWKLQLKRFVMMMSILFLVMLPWGIRNSIQFGEFAVTRTVLWQGIWEGFGEFQNPFGAVLNDKITHEQVSQELGRSEFSDAEFQAALKRKSLEALRQYPQWYAKMLPKRLVKMVLIGGYGFWNHLFEPNPAYGYSAAYKVNYPQGNIIGYLRFLATDVAELCIRLAPFVYKGLLLLLAGLGAWLWRKEWKKLVLLFSVYAYGILSHLPIYWEPRYLITTEFPLIFFSALALYEAIPLRFRDHSLHRDRPISH